MEKFLSEQLKRNIANQVAIEKAMGRSVTDEQCLDILEKGGKRAQLGEVRTWNGKEYIKTPKGWVRKPKGYREGNTQKEVQKERGHTKNFDSAVEKFVEAIEDHGYTLADLQKFTPEDFFDNFGIKISQSDLDAALDTAIDRCDVDDDFYGDDDDDDDDYDDDNV